LPSGQNEIALSESVLVLRFGRGKNPRVPAGTFPQLRPRFHDFAKAAVGNATTPCVLINDGSVGTMTTHRIMRCGHGDAVVLCEPVRR
jgi:hypothetical protein